MFTEQASRHHTTVQQLGELSVAAPQVMVHRMSRMLMAGPVLSEHDREEFTGMVMEKQLAFTESWLAMVGEAMRVQQSLLLSFFGGAPSLWSLNPLTMWLNLAAHQNEAVHRVFSEGLTPLHSKAVSNSQRLSNMPISAR